MSARFRTWSDGPEAEEFGNFVGRFQVALAELQAIDSRSLAQEMGMTEDVLDDYEATGQPWTQFADWVWEQI